MYTLGRSAVVFAVATFLTLVVVDVMMSMLVTPAPPAPQRQSVLVAHMTFHTLVLSLIGAAVGFVCVRRRLPTTRQALVLGVVFGLASLFGGTVVAVAEGPLLAALWLLFGSMAFSIGGALLAKPWGAEKHT